MSVACGKGKNVRFGEEERKMKGSAVNEGGVLWVVFLSFEFRLLSCK